MLHPKLAAASGFGHFVLILQLDLKAVKQACAFAGKIKHLLKIEEGKYLFITFLFGFGFVFYFFFSFFWKDGEKVTAELQQGGVHRSALQAAFKATFSDKKIKHNQRRQLFFLSPERPCEISALRRTEGDTTSQTRQSIAHQPPVTAQAPPASRLLAYAVGELRVLFAMFGHNFFFLMKSPREPILRRCQGRTKI